MFAIVPGDENFCKTFNFKANNIVNPNKNQAVYKTCGDDPGQAQPQLALRVTNVKTRLGCFHVTAI